MLMGTTCRDLVTMTFYERTWNYFIGEMPNRRWKPNALTNSQKSQSIQWKSFLTTSTQPHLQ